MVKEYAQNLFKSFDCDGQGLGGTEIVKTLRYFFN